MLGFDVIIWSFVRFKCAGWETTCIGISQILKISGTNPWHFVYRFESLYLYTFSIQFYIHLYRFYIPLCRFYIHIPDRYKKSKTHFKGLCTQTATYCWHCTLHAAASNRQTFLCRLRARCARAPTSLTLSVSSYLSNACTTAAARTLVAMFAV